MTGSVVIYMFWGLEWKSTNNLRFPHTLISTNEIVLRQNKSLLLWCCNVPSYSRHLILGIFHQQEKEKLQKSYVKEHMFYLLKASK